MHPNWQQICDEFMAATSYELEGFDEVWAGRTGADEPKPEVYTTHPEAEHVVSLGEPEMPEGPNLWQLLKTRRSRRNFLDQPLTFNQLNLLLWSGQGITADMGPYQLRTAPSAGALYPIETYVAVNAVEGLEPGIYHLNVADWSLEAIKLGCHREAVHRVLRGQSMTELAAVNLIWVANIPRCRVKYYERAYRYIFWDSAMVAENLLLAAESLELGACVMGSWYDDLAHELLGLDGRDHVSVLTASVGPVRGEDWREDRRPPARG